jgi:hypothetical protein
MNRLINDTLIKADILSDIARTPDPVSMWFRGVNFHDVMFNIIIPLVFIIALSFIAKDRYNRKQRRANSFY